MGIIFLILQILRPDPNLTPGRTVPVTLIQVCTPGYSKSVRNVPQSLKKKVFLEYDLDPTLDHFEIDHLISLELGGSNDLENLWAQSYTTQPYNAHVKDSLENKLHWMVCHNAISLEKAQQEISTDWIAAYEKYVPKKVK